MFKFAAWYIPLKILTSQYFIEYLWIQNIEFKTRRNKHVGLEWEESVLSLSFTAITFALQFLY